MLNKSKVLLATGLLTMAGAANAGYTFDLTPDDKITFGGYIKADLRYTDGAVAANNYWYGGGGVGTDISNIGLSVNETRFNAKYVHGDVTGFIEMDFYGGAVKGNGNEIISNSSNPRLRHAFIKYKNVLVGQTWTTFQNTSSLAEAADFGGPLNASAFIRQGQIRYTNGNLQLAIENPETYGGTSGDDSIPDFIAKYTFKGDWGNVSVSGLVRQLNTETVAAIDAAPAVIAGGVTITPAVVAVPAITSDTETSFGYGIAGRIKTVGKDDFRFQLHAGEVGRYVGVTAAKDVVGKKVEETESYMVAYRHFWNDDMRSTVFHGTTRAKYGNTKRNHTAVNLFKSITKQLSYGIEVGNYDVDDSATKGDSNYVQVSAKYVL